MAAKDLANSVAAKMKTSVGLMDCHRNGCGHGFAYSNGEFHYGEVRDGSITSLGYTWPDEGDFVAFLAKEDYRSCEESADTYHDHIHRGQDKSENRKMSRNVCRIHLPRAKNT